MSDDRRIRDLERRARQGDPDASRALAVAVERTLRDPRIDPQPGDVVAAITPTSRLHVRRVLEVHGSGTSLYAAWVDEDGESLSDVAISLASWKRWARRPRGTVLARGPLHAAPDLGEPTHAPASSEGP